MSLWGASLTLPMQLGSILEVRHPDAHDVKRASNRKEVAQTELGARGILGAQNQRLGPEDTSWFLLELQ